MVEHGRDHPDDHRRTGKGGLFCHDAQPGGQQVPLTGSWLTKGPIYCHKERYGALIILGYNQRYYRRKTGGREDYVMLRNPRRWAALRTACLRESASARQGK